MYFSSLFSVCDCHLLGTIDNAGCDKQDGACFCKRFVTGHRCDECYVSIFF